MLNNELLNELRIILIEEYQLELSDEEISDLGNCLVSCFQILAEGDDDND